MKETCGVIEDLADLYFRFEKEKIRIQHQEGKALLYHVPNDQIFEINPTALEILSMLDGQHSCLAIAEALCMKYQVSQEEVMKDLSEFLGLLEKLELVQKVK